MAISFGVTTNLTVSGTLTASTLTSAAGQNMTLAVGTGGTVLTLTNSTLAATFAGALTVTGNLTVSGTGTSTIAGSLTISSALTAGSINGNITIGASGPVLSSSIVARTASQGLVFDGSPGICSLANGPILSTTDCTFEWAASVASASGSYCVLGGATGAPFLAYDSSTINIAVMGGALTALSSYVPVAGKMTHYALTRSDSGWILYANGIQVGTATATKDFTVAPTTIGKTPSDTYDLVGTLETVRIYNRALSAAEVLTLWETGRPAAADYYGSTIAALSPSSALNTYTTSWETFSSDATSATCSDTTESKAGIRIRIPVAMTAGKKYRVSFSVNFAEMAACGLYTESAPYTGAATVNATLVSGSVNTYEFTATMTLTGLMIIASTNATDAAHTFSYTGLTITPIGLLLAPDQLAQGNGYVWGDKSGNGAHIVLPTSGVAWALPSSGPNHIRGTTSTSGNQALLGGATLLPANIQLLRVRARARTNTPTITIGTASGGSQIVASVALSTTWKDLTIALTGGIVSTADDIWIGSDSADVVETDILWDPLNF